MVATAKRFTSRPLSRSEEATEERALEKLNRMFAKAVPIAARKRATALKNFQRDLAAQIRRSS